MRTLLILLSPFFFLALYPAPDFSKIREGDLIFQETNSRQAEALQLATKSLYTHVGIVFKENKQYYVLEAVQPVRYTSLENFVNRGVNQHFVVKRLKNSGGLLTPENISRMKKVGKSFLGKNYDPYFEWSDDRMYCTELVWKVYFRSMSIEVGQLEKLGDFDLSHPVVKKILRERFGNNIPLSEKVISVSTMFASKNLETVMEYR